MTEGREIKAPGKIRREGGERAAKSPVKKAVSAGSRPDPSAEPARPRPTVKTAVPRPRQAEPGSSAPRPPRPASVSGAVSRPRPEASRKIVPPPAGKPPAVGSAAEATPVRRPKTGRPVRREKSLEGLGRLLKTKREIHGLTRRDVVVKIKIPLDQLEAIEEGRLSSLPPVFAKGFLRAYANELGLDAEAILEDYRQLTGGFKNEPASREPLAPRYVETSVGKSGGMGWGVKLAVFSVLILLLAGGLVLWLWPGLRAGLGSSVPLLNKIPGFSQTDTTARGPSMTIPAGSSDVDSSREPADDGGDFVADPIEPSGVGGVISTIPAAAPAGGILTLASRMDRVWVQVEIDGASPQYLIMRNGQQMTWQARRQITVTTGQANALSVNWNGEDLGPLGQGMVAQSTFPKGG